MNYIYGNNYVRLFNKKIRVKYVDARAATAEKPNEQTTRAWHLVVSASTCRLARSLVLLAHGVALTKGKI